MKSIFILILIYFSSLLNNCAWADASSEFERSNGVNFKVLRSLVDSGVFFGSVPFIKEMLYESQRVNDASLDELIDEISSNIGLRQFESLQAEVLEKSHAATIRYVLAKKYFSKNNFEGAINALNGARTAKNIEPFAEHLKGSANLILKRSSDAQKNFENCISLAESLLSNSSLSKLRKKQLVTVKDSCLIGIARLKFSEQKFNDSVLTYLDLPKKSPIWPEILFEEAWSSFYSKDYNRTLGKLVTYKAPVLEYIFNPEIEVLTSLTYLEMCLYEDAKNTANNFYTKYQRGFLALNNLLQSSQSDYKSYYFLVKERDKLRFDPLIIKLLDDVGRDPATYEMLENLAAGKNEISIVKSIGNRKLKYMVAKNLKESLILQRDLIGSYVKKKLTFHSRLLEKSFQDMSYIKLEILNNVRSKILGITDTRERGDIKFLERNEKQYFWSFNGEFWADEIGDYVFALKSECTNEISKI